MAASTLSHELQESNPTLDRAAHELYLILEDHLAELGLDEAERDERYVSAEAHVMQKDAALDKASASLETADGHR